MPQCRGYRNAGHAPKNPRQSTATRRSHLLMKRSAGWLTLGLILISGGPPATAGPQGRGEVTVADAMNVIEEMNRKSGAQVPPKILSKAQGIAIIPGQFKAGFVFGARYGRGLVMVRQEDGTWSNP